MLKKVAVFISGGGSNLQSLIDYKGSYEISLVISDQENAKGLLRAKNHNINSIYIGKNNFSDKKTRTDEILKILKQNSIEIIVLAGFLSIIDKKITDKYEQKIINIHPSLIPSFCGMGFYGENVHKAVYDSGVKITGATVHFVDDKVDTGAIICQQSVIIDNNDTIKDIASKVLNIEHSILPKALENLCLNKIEINYKRTYIGD